MSDHKESGSTRSQSASISSTDSEFQTSRTQSRPQSLAGSLRTRLRSLSNSGTTQVDRVYSGRHFNDQSVYHSDDASNYGEPSVENEHEPDAIQEVRNGIVNERDLDLEKADTAEPELEKSRTTKSNRSRHDPKLKWAATITVSLFTFISPVSSSMVAPALPSLAADLKVTDEVVSQLMLSIFVLAYAVGPLFLGPLSEIYGRTIDSAARQPLLLSFQHRIGGGVLSDCFRAEERGKGVAIYSLAPLLGPALGPIAGGFIAENTTWRWVFYSTSITDGLIQVMGLFFLRESYGPKILLDRAVRLRKETGDDSYQTEAERQNKTLPEVLRSSLVRPFRLLLTQPIVQVLALFMAYIYGIMYLVLSTFPTLWTSPSYYNESTGIGGLNYISLGLGFWLGSQICAPLNDRIYRRLKARNADVGKPEFRVPLLFVGAFFIPAGLFIYGWTQTTDGPFAQAIALQMVTWFHLTKKTLFKRKKKQTTLIYNRNFALRSLSRW
ncbi:hypothetical protein N7505_010970 [Penicillium chrysogenum]|uniref:Major facilitator superfamily (MFS) profile domain-containing protein n=1 Tax=Penicillium chrysogenum TaxID=5076 RepID=A0ABQ8W556_PENCH|nr:hypothetical protein N7505_010970 [Penicillium chrysogenum]